MPVEGLLLELTKAKLLGKYSTAKSFFLIVTSEEKASEEQHSFLPASSKEQIGLRRKNSWQFSSHTSAMSRHFVLTQICIYF